MTSHDRYVAKHRLLGAAAAWSASEHQLQAATPGPNDDAQSEYHDDWLLSAAREFVAAHADINLNTQETHTA
jgi:hypothetical protein